MEHNTTIPSILSLTHQADPIAKPSGGITLMKVLLWGLLAALAILVFRLFRR